ncbi:MAG TPA: aminoglycoside phosphotransferase family protein [Acidimicrobiales bacterium]|nr:aminoglycoside phosphotransferase family protein [Acidimicrobiales bacterium]
MHREAFPLPSNLVEGAARDGRDDWIATLPSVVGELVDRWALDLGSPFQPGGQTAWVAPALSPEHGPVVLKVGWRHFEADDEAEGLRFWDGGGVVQLHESLELETCHALLLERCVPGTPLSARPEPEQDGVVARILNGLWRDVGSTNPFRTLQVMCDRWADSFEQKAIANATVDPGLARTGAQLFRDLPGTAERAVVLATDLHAGNILSAERAPWLAIDPKPFVGDPAYDLLQHMLNCPARLQSAVGDFARRMADLAGVGHERLLQWLFARCIVESLQWPELLNVAGALRPL